MKVEVIPFLALALWAFGWVACFRECRRRGNECAVFTDLVCSLIFWPLLLPVWGLSAAWTAGAMFGNQIVRYVDQRRNPQALRSGADNGLYD